MIKIRLQVLLMLILASPALAVGVDCQKMGLRAYGCGGFVGLANDSAAIAFNPAGLTRLASGQTQWELATTLVELEVQYRSADGSQSYSHTVPVIPAAFIATASTQAAGGLGLYAPLGTGGIEFNNVALPQLGGAEVFLQGYQGGAVAAPAVAMKLNPNLALGLTLEIFNIQTEAELKVPALNAAAELKADCTNAGYDLKLGLLAKLDQGLNLGLQIKTPAQLKTNGRLTELAGSAAGVYVYREQQRVPLYVILGLSYELNPKLVLVSDLGWRQWNHYRKQSLTTDSGVGSLLAQNIRPGTWNNTYTLSAGLSYAATPVLTLRSGLQWQPSCVRVRDATFSSTDKDTAVWTGGMELRLNEALQLHLVSGRTWALERQLNSGGKGSGSSWECMLGLTGSF